jgi:Tol biopolymer transport system component
MGVIVTMKHVVKSVLLLSVLLFFPQWASAQSSDIESYAPTDATRLLLVSPDGTKVIGTPDLRGDELCVYSVPAAEAIACTDLRARDIQLNITDLAWSPDSSTVVFAERPLITFIDGDLWTMDAATAELTNLTDDNFIGDLPFLKPDDTDQPVYADILPRFSPDGTAIAFTRSTFAGPDALRPTDLMVLDLATGELREIARVTEDEPGVIYFGITWSPDGGTIYASIFHADQSNTDNGVWAFDVATGEGSHLAGATDDFEGATPAVMSASPRGDLLTVYYPAVLGQFGAKESAFGLLSIETGEIAAIAAPESLAIPAAPASVLAPGFSPDGSSLLFLARGYGEISGALVVRNLESGEDQITELPDNLEPTINGYGDGTVLGVDGRAFVLTSLNAAVLVSVDDPALAVRPETATTPQATPGATTGTTLEITGTYVELHAAPTSDAPVVFVFTVGDEVEQIGEPVEVDGETWIPVRDPASGTIGYLLAENLNDPSIP